jgi:hypothetical protein
MQSIFPSIISRTLPLARMRKFAASSHTKSFTAFSTMATGNVQMGSSKESPVRFPPPPFFSSGPYHYRYQSLDYVRLRACLDPPHWKPTKGDKWDAGYETTAYFLDWLERRRAGTVRHLNDLMKDVDYTDDIFQVAAGDDVKNLWQSYRATLENS